MNTNKSLVAFFCLVASAHAWASGFALYEPSAVSHAMGGALVGKAMDASANYNNPATLTDLTNIQVSVGFVTEHPRGCVRYSRAGGSYRDECCDPGLFWLPHLQIAAPLPADLTFGLGIGADYGLGTRYGTNWGMNFSSVETTIQGLVINPNIAYKVTDDWSVGAGLRWLYFDFEQYSAPQVVNNGVELARFNNRVEGNNKFDSLGWQIGTKYDVTKTFSVGAVYKSAIHVDVDGTTRNRVRNYNDRNINAVAAAQAPDYAKQALAQKGIVQGSVPEAMYSAAYAQAYAQAYDTVRSTVRNQVDAGARSHSGIGGAELTLPQSVTAGCNWDVYKTWHLGAMVSWTQWSELDHILFELPGENNDVRLDWKDTWRASVASCWDFHEDWKWMVSYTYDMDCTTDTQQSTMLPPADRHILATGLSWNCWNGLEFALSYACIFMAGGDIRVEDRTGEAYRMETCWGYCHAVGFSVTYRF